MAAEVILQQQSKRVKPSGTHEDVIDENNYKWGKKRVESSSDTEGRHPVIKHSQDAIWNLNNIGHFTPALSPEEPWHTKKIMSIYDYKNVAPHIFIWKSSLNWTPF